MRRISIFILNQSQGKRSGKIALPLRPTTVLRRDWPRYMPWRLAWRYKGIPGEELAWCAGMLDGEGCIQIKKQRVKGSRSPSHYVTVTVTSLSKPAVESMVRILGGNFRFWRGAGVSRTVWRWEMSGHPVKYVLASLFPFLRIKQVEALLAIRLYELPRRYGVNGRVDERTIRCREALYGATRRMKQRGWEK